MLSGFELGDASIAPRISLRPRLEARRRIMRKCRVGFCEARTIAELAS